MHVAFLVRKTNNDNSFAKQNTNPKPLVCIMGRVGLVLALGGVTRVVGGARASWAWPTWLWLGEYNQGGGWWGPGA